MEAVPRKPEEHQPFVRMPHLETHTHTLTRIRTITSLAAETNPIVQLTCFPAMHQVLSLAVSLQIWTLPRCLLISVATSNITRKTTNKLPQLFLILLTRSHLPSSRIQHIGSTPLASESQGEPSNCRKPADSHGTKTMEAGRWQKQRKTDGRFSSLVASTDRFTDLAF